MIKEMKAWKVISWDRISCSAILWENSNCAIHYPVNVEVFPKIKGSKIFVFKNRIDAETFSGYNYLIGFSSLIVPCIAKNAVKVKWICNIGSDHIKDFWKKRSKSDYKSKAPKGTYLAESITCLE